MYDTFLCTYVCTLYIHMYDVYILSMTMLNAVTHIIYHQGKVEPFDDEIFLYSGSMDFISSPMVNSSNFILASARILFF